MTVTFTDGEVGIQLQPHNDALVIVAGINHVATHQVLVDRGSSTNVLPLRVLRMLKWNSTKLKKCPSPLIGFTGEKIYP